VPTLTKLLSISEHAACWGIVTRAMHNRLSAIRPDQQGSGVRGNPNLYSAEVVARVMLGSTAEEANERLDLDQERARQAKASADKLELENALRRGEVAPMNFMSDEITQYTRQLAAFLDGLGPNMRRILPHLAETDHARVDAHLIHERSRLSTRLASASEPVETDQGSGRGAVNSTAEAIGG
jgi:phage terminase Nu1 subunit (DNA packaging protein)